ncbi:VanZ family protein [Rubrivirga sp. S365]|uniref:VanZ family protein n=1 Tax=Rubrivirga sp. S365 TaxID=3076080 RepID=UPI0028C905F1|nr:VanZ family protein [Rubrivirga sp. S365]MDT7856858.1 VanZ family protein [Rubrivirga sp. S365]
MPLRPTRLAIAAAWSVLAALGLFLPGRVFPALGPIITTAAHVVFFTGFAGLWAWALPRFAVYIVIAAVFVAVGTEGFQMEIVPGRGLETRDLWADFVGIGLGWGLARLWRRRRMNRAYRPRRRRSATPPRTGAARTRQGAGSSVHA